jgi:acyl-CoA synthetase (AMP-forming)/AMP-acid ligase II
VTADGEGGWLRTGDLGVLTPQGLCVTGRLKDVVKLNGRTVHLHDLEETARDSHPALRAGGGVAFAVPGTEDVVLLHELADPEAVVDRGEVLASIRRAVAAEHGLALVAAGLLRPGEVPHTTSGKVQRRACADAWASGDLQPVARWDRGPGRAQAGGVPTGRALP